MNILVCQSFVKHWVPPKIDINLRDILKLAYLKKKIICKISEFYGENNTYERWKWIKAFKDGRMNVHDME